MVTFFNLFPEVVFRTRSIHNHDICVVRQWGGYKLLVNGSPQSGPYIRMLWNRALRKFRINSLLNIRTILVLGVGGGTVIELLARQYPNATITAVDIDKTMIDIAKRYFRSDSIANLRVVCGDAKVFVRSCSRYDLVIVDLFIGPKIPEFVSSTPILKNLYAIVGPGGHLVINYLRELEYQEKSDELMVRLNALWGPVKEMNLYNNRFFLAG